MPRLKVLKREFKVVMLVDNVGIIVDCDGQPVGGSLVFGGCPDGIGEIGSSLVALDGDKELVRMSLLMMRMGRARWWL